MNSFEFTFFVNPVAKGRPRFGKGRCYTPKKTVDFEREIRSIARKYILHRYSKFPWPIKTPIVVDLVFWFAKPKKPKFDVPAVRPDVDNFCKSVLDALNSLIIQDDSLIVKLIAEKKYSTDEPKIDLTIYEV